MNIPVIQLENITKSFGDLVLYENLNLTLTDYLHRVRIRESCKLLSGTMPRSTSRFARPMSQSMSRLEKPI